MQFLTTLRAFLKALPEVTGLMNKLLDFIKLQQELAAAKADLAAREAEIAELRKAITAIQSPTHDNTALNNMFNGVH